MEFIPGSTQRKHEQCLKHSPGKAMARIGGMLASYGVNKKFSDSKRMVLNVGGYRYEILRENLMKHPETLLGSERKDLFFDKKRREYFFDRDPIMFKYILEFYRTGDFHISPQAADCVDAISDELAFFGIPKELVSSCCCENIDFEHKKEEELDKGESRVPQGQKEKLYEFLTETKSSLGASVFSFFFVLVIVVNIIMINIETLQCSITQNCGEYYKTTFFVVDSLCVVVFTLEFFARFYSCPSRLDFIKDISNIVDWIGILPYYIGIFEKLLKSNNTALQSIITALRIARIFRVTKLARHSVQFQNLLRSIADAAGELGGILFSFLAVMITFSSCVYFAETKLLDDPGGFTSIPAAVWYTLVTMTTLGYGDIVPATFPGKIVGSMCALMGVLLLALPVPIIEEKLNANTKREARRRDAKSKKGPLSKKLASSVASVNRLRNKILKKVDMTSHQSMSSIGNETSSVGINERDLGQSNAGTKVTKTPPSGDIQIEMKGLPSNSSVGKEESAANNRRRTEPRFHPLRYDENRESISGSLVDHVTPNGITLSCARSVAGSREFSS